MSVTLSRIQHLIETAYPPRLAEAWDTGIGLTCGDPTDEVASVLLAVDVDDDTVTEAIDLGAQLLLTHHPLLFRPVQSVASSTPKGRLISRLTKAGVAHLAAHTNADRAAGGVNDALAEALGLLDIGPLIGRLEVAEAERGGPVEPPSPMAVLGRIGTLPVALSATAFTSAIAGALPATVTGARLAGDRGRTIRRVAVCGGAGGSLLPTVALAGVDAFVTADLGHHATAEFIAEPGRPVLIDVSHWASEWPWLRFVEKVLISGQDPAGTSAVEVVVSTRRTDPWSARAGG